MKIAEKVEVTEASNCSEQPLSLLRPRLLLCVQVRSRRRGRREEQKEQAAGEGDGKVVIWWWLAQMKQKEEEEECRGRLLMQTKTREK